MSLLKQRMRTRAILAVAERRLECPTAGRMPSVLISFLFTVELYAENRLGEPPMDARPRTKAAKKRRVRLKEERRLKKTRSRVMPMLSRPKKLKANKRAAS